MDLMIQWRDYLMMVNILEKRMVSYKYDVDENGFPINVTESL